MVEMLNVDSLPEDMDRRPPQIYSKQGFKFIVFTLKRSG